MKHVGIATVLAASFAAAAGARAGAEQQNLVRNGDFRAGKLSGSWQPLYPGSTAIDGWTVERPVDYVETFWQSSNNGRSIDLDGTPGPGAISQTMRTVPGTTYDVAFDLAGNPDGPPRVKLLQVTVGGVEARFSFDAKGHTKTSMGYERKHVTFRATGTTAKLRFASLDDVGNWNGPVIDNVVVVPVAPGAQPASAAAAPAAAPVRAAAPAPAQRKASLDLSGRWDGELDGGAKMQVAITVRNGSAEGTMIGASPNPNVAAVSWNGAANGRHFVVLERCSPESGKPLLFGATITTNDDGSFDLSKNACLGSAVRFTRAK